MKRVALYCRVSTSEQVRSGESVEDQLQSLRRWAEDNDCIVVGEYLDEGFSARKSYKTRPSMRSLLSDIQTGEIETILVTKLDRWFRNLQDYYKVQEILDENKVCWKAILEDYETETSAGRFKLNIMLSVAQHEADQTSDRIKFTFQQKRERGEVCSGSMPRGYIIKDKRPVKDPESMVWVQSWWDAYTSTGKVIKANEYVEANFGIKFDTAQGAFMARQASLYAGIIQGIQCEPYITEEQLDALNKARKHHPRSSPMTYIFSGLIVCGECGGRMGGHNFVRKTKTNGTKSRKSYNCCRRQMRKHPICGNRATVQESDIEEHILSTIEMELDRLATKAELEEKKRQSVRDTDRLKSELNRLEVKKNKLVDLYLDEEIDRESYTQKKHDIEQSIKRIKESLKEEKVVSPQRIRAVLPEGWREMYTELDEEHKRSFWVRVLDRIEINADRSISFSFAI